jgi:hypothetical protein
MPSSIAFAENIAPAEQLPFMDIAEVRNYKLQQEGDHLALV